LSKAPPGVPLKEMLWRVSELPLSVGDIRADSNIPSLPRGRSPKRRLDGPLPFKGRVREGMG
jgi:hypothetical protein